MSITNALLLYSHPAHQLFFSIFKSLANISPAFMFCLDEILSTKRVKFEKYQEKRRILNERNRSILIK